MGYLNNGRPRVSKHEDEEKKENSLKFNATYGNSANLK